MVGPGTSVANRFVIEAQAGEGGMGAVYRARDARTGRVVALKLLGPDYEGRDAVLFDEARALASLSHPSIVRYVDHGDSTEGAYLAMEWIDGESLEERLTRGPLTIVETLTLGRCVAQALSAAHRAGLVHRDIKPANLVLAAGRVESVTLVDFGLALGHAKALTQTGIVVGTPWYMAPEQARGERGVDARADVFSLGCVLFECLTGEPPFQGEHMMAVLLKIVLEDPPRLRERRPDASDGLDELVALMLSKDPSLRPPDGAALERAFAALSAPRLPRTSGPLTLATLTTGEQRLLSVVLARAPKDDETLEDTITIADPHQQGETLQAVRQAALAHQAFCEHLADGSIVATLSATGAATDLALRAARLAQALRAALRGWSLALATGRGELAARWPVGEAVDRAVAVLGPPGRIRLDEVTAGLLAGHIALEGDERTPELGTPSEALETTRTVLGRPTPYVGREREFLGVLAAFEHCVAESVAHAVLVVGPPGIGKSRLWHELVRLVSGRAVLLIAQGGSLHAGAPFGLLGPALRRLCRIRGDDDPEAQRRKLQARVERVVPEADRSRVVCFLGELVGAPFGDDDVQLHAARQDARLMSDQIRRAVEDWLTAECARTPVVLVLDDLQWGDGPTVQVVDSALRTLADSSLFVLGLARPEVDVAFPGLWSDRGVERIDVQPLTQRAAERLVRTLLGGDVAPERLSAIVTRAEGNAFFLEELVRAEALGRGAEAPATVLAMLQARIEALPAMTRRVLRAASVFGRTFWRSGIAALVGDAGAGGLDAALDELVRAEIAQRSPESRFGAEEQAVLRHDLYRDAAYSTLTRADRVLGHSLAARWLERVGERDALVLAEHYERGGQPASAVPWWVAAARQALETSDLAAATERAARGLAAGATGAARGGLLLVQAEAASWSGESARSLEAGLAALEALPHESVPWFAAVGAVSIAAGRLGRLDHLRAMGEALARARTDGDVAVASALAFARTIPPLVYASELSRADLLLARLPEIDDRLAATEPKLAGQCRSARAVRALATGDTAAFLAGVRASGALFERAGDLRSVCLGDLHVGYAAMELGDLAQAEARLRQVLYVARRLNLAAVETLAQHNLGIALLRAGRVEEAEAFERAAVRGGLEEQDPRLEAASRAYLAAIHAKRGSHAEAIEEVTRALAVLGEAPSAAGEAGAVSDREPPRAGAPVAALAFAMLARIEATRGDGRASLEAARRGMAIVEHLGGALEEGEGLVRLVHAEALYAAGHHAAARGAITAARRRLLDRAARIGDPDLRASFLERVEEHARTLALATEWECSEPS